ncbi:unnamed protein product [Ranitomeya imitator]|uniref:Helix-turn-helix domain-containing protein n=1 Tax=Ranitomeya imitator TaxID=111125 RepID=A0ABN9LMY0_9NEOB|nr:unnamed protein product [Ranitomeya imitator]
MPPVTNDLGTVDVFVNLVSKEIMELEKREKKHFHNLTKAEMISLRELESDHERIIKPSDKGGNVVVLDVIQYKQMCYSLLNMDTGYEKLGSNPTTLYHRELKDLVMGAFEKKVIDINERDYLIPSHPVVATFYCLPKVHKGINPLKGRPIVSGIDSLTQKLGLYIDRILRPFVISLSSYIRDTTDLLLKLDQITLDEDMRLCSIDVEALYSSIPHNKGVMAVDYYLSTRGRQYYEHNRFVIQALEFCLTRNYFLFDGKYFHQLRGTAMGSPCAPSYANLLLGWWEENVVFGDTTESNIILWLRYIDDVFVIWKGDEKSFQTFVTGLNSNDLGLQFTFESNACRLPFLDVVIEKGEDGQLYTSTYRKPTASNSLLRWESNHPFPLRRGIPKGQYLRIRRNCSNPLTFKKQADKLITRFHERGYPDNVLREAYTSASARDRKDLLTPGEKREDSNPIRFITKYTNGAKDLRTILQRHWSILQMDMDLRDMVTISPQITFGRGRSIKDRVVHSHFTPPLFTSTKFYLDRWASERML